ncbi:YtpI family protein [Natribacillus halophilus]|uniref:YtpI-like protein n=1 Tax=Natribacillus halophilus TaxID=549003 RepID=A0A1G8NCZ1_9BACI|nr:YtpI family protein [Natribacillus halophilus]SDI78032.1 YtpI-like protein [Natribacillus halophilus]
MAIVAIAAMAISIALYAYNKFKRFRAPGDAMKQWYQTKSMISLGVFILAPGLLFTLPPFWGFVELTVGLVFSLLGLVYVIYGTKYYRKILPYAREESEAMRVSRGET